MIIGTAVQRYVSLASLADGLVTSGSSPRESLRLALKCSTLMSLNLRHFIPFLVEGGLAKLRVMIIALWSDGRPATQDVLRSGCPSFGLFILLLGQTNMTQAWACDYSQENFPIINDTFLFKTWLHACKIKNKYVLILRERAKRASASETYICRTQNTSAYIHNQYSFV